MKRNQHPFRRRGAAAPGRFCVWTGHGGEWVPIVQKQFDPWASQKNKTRDVFLPTKPLIIVARAPELADARKLVKRVARVDVKGTGWENHVWDKQSGSWWMITEA